MQCYRRVGTRVMDLDEENFLYRELLGSPNSNFIDSNDKETPIRWGLLRFSIANSLEQATSLLIIREIATFDVEGE